MNLEKFNAQTLSEKYDSLCSWGFYMFRRSMGSTTVALFSVHSFFAEVIINTKDSTLIEVRPYSSEELPLEYYRQVNIDAPFVSVGTPTAQLIESLLEAA
jgi:hypothetical protein